MCALTLVLVAAAVAAEPPPSVVLDVSVSRGELTVDVRNAPLAQVLRTVGEKAGIEVSLRGDFTGSVTQSFSGLPLEDGIRRLAGGHSVAVSYASSTDALRRETPARVWVIAGSGTSAGVSAPLGDARGDSSQPGTLAPPDRKTDVATAGTTVRVPIDAWVGGIRALTEEAGRGSEAAVALLIDFSASAPDADVRQGAVAALGRISRAEVEPALTAALADNDASVRAQAVRALRGTGTETAMQSLAAAMLGDADPQVRLAALRAFASLPGRPSLPALARATSDPNHLVRETAIQALSWWSTHRSGASQ